MNLEPHSILFTQQRPDRSLTLAARQVLMTRAEMQLGARLRKWGPARLASLERYLARFGICHPDSALCDL